MRLKYRVKDLDKLKSEYLAQRSAARDAATPGPDGETIKIAVWPRSLTDLLERRLRAHLELPAYPLDPAGVVTPGKSSFARPQTLPASALAFEHPPFKNLSKIDEISTIESLRVKLAALHEASAVNQKALQALAALLTPSELADCLIADATIPTRPHSES